MPGQNGGWLHHSQTFYSAIPEAGEQDPEDTIDGPKPGAKFSVNEAPKLVAQGEPSLDPGAAHAFRFTHQPPKLRA